MKFSFKRLNDEELGRIRCRVRGSQLLLGNSCVSDDANHVCLVSLGSESLGRTNDPRDLYNLFWGEYVITIEAQSSFVSEDEATVLLLTIRSLGIPKACDIDPDIIRRTLEDAAAAYFGTVLRRTISVRVVFPDSVDRI